MSRHEKLTPAEKVKRDAKRARRAERREAEAAAPPKAFVERVPVDHRQTMSRVITRADLLRKISTVHREMIARTGPEADRAAIVLGKQVTCHTCTAPKGCCHLSVIAFFYEAIPIVDRLRRDGRDTQELRDELRAAAELMESTSPNEYRRPCAFLSEDERCTIYEDRPQECGMAFVFSDPMNCSDPNATSIDKFVTPFSEFPPQFEAKFEHEAKLARLPGPYMGALPRMILLALEAWERPDFVEHLAREVPQYAQRAITTMAAAHRSSSGPQPTMEDSTD